MNNNFNYKPSMFNYITKNRNKELLMFNSYTGTSSFTKISRDNCDMIEKWLSGELIPDYNSKEFEVLNKRGFFVDSNKNEKASLKYKTMKFVNDNILHLTIFTTGQCNFRCEYCCESFEHGSMDKESQMKIVKYVEKNIKNFRGLQVDWFGGEPMLGYDAIKFLSENFMKICNLNKKPYIATITTNGYLLDVDTFKKMMKLKICSYTISIDGLEESHNRQRHLCNGNKTFKTIINNLKDIKKEVKTSAFQIKVRTNFTKEIFEQIDDYIDFFSAELNDNRFSFFIRLAADWGGESVKNIKESLLSSKDVKKIYERFAASGKIKNFDALISFFNFGGCVCSASQMNGYVIDTFANVYKCSRIYNKDFQVGMIKGNGILELDEDKVYEWLNNFDMCANDECKFAPLCLHEPCAKFRITSDCRAGKMCPSEVENINEIFQLLDLNSQYFKILI